MKQILILAAFICFATAGKPWEPEPRNDQWWVDRHNEFVENNRNNGANIKIVFTGSSSIEHWASAGQKLWNEKYEPLGAVNYGFGGDQIQHCLWRAMNGELENINPKLLVLYCGSNNIDDSVDDTVRGIKETLAEIQRRLPETKILYMNINPRGDIQPVTELFDKTRAINAELIQLHDGEKISVFDMFLDLIIMEGPWGQINTELFEGDKIHLNTKGYELWDRLWNDMFYKLLE